MSKGAVKARRAADRSERRAERFSERERAQRSAGFIWAEAASYARERSVEGITTAQLDEEIEKLVMSRGGVPTNKGYDHGRRHTPYPAATCFMPNDMVSHGIPNSRPLKNGDILTFDMGVTVDGMHADAAITYPIGEIPDEVKKFIYTCNLALRNAIRLCTPGTRTGALSRAIESVVMKEKYGIVKELCGHGINSKYHDEPNILNVYLSDGPKLHKGQAIAIEPIITMGSPEIKVGADGWSLYTVDGSLAAQFEHTVVVDDVPKILTIL